MFRILLAPFPCIAFWALGMAAGSQGADLASLGVSANRKAAADQALTPDRERRAEALAHYVAGQLALKDGRGREALQHYRAALAADPGETMMAVEAAKLAVQYEGRSAALKLLEDELKRHPGTLAGYAVMVEFCLSYPAEGSAQFEPAIAAAEEAVKRFPERADSYALATRAHLAAAGVLLKPEAAKMERDKAEKLLDEALVLPSRDANFWLVLGRSAQDVWPLADSDHRKERLPKVNAFFEKALQCTAGGADEVSELAIADYFLLSNQLDRSLSICEGIVTRSGSLDARKRVVRLLDAMDKSDEALKSLEDLTRAYPSDVESRQLLANLYLQRVQVDKAKPQQEKLDVEKAVAELEAAVKAGGGQLQDYLTICRLMQFSGTPERFYQFTQRAAQLFPGEPRVMFYSGTALNMLSKYAEASEVLQRAAKIAESRAPDQLTHDFYFERGRALERTGHIEEAAQQFEKSIELTPTDNLETAANAMNYLGYMWLENGTHLDRAEELIKKANELTKPESSAFVDSLGWVYFKRGKFEDALSTLLHAESLQKEWTPEDAEILDHIAQAYEKMGNKDKAAEYWKRALALDPNSDEVRQHAEQALGIKTPRKPAKPAPDK